MGRAWLLNSMFCLLCTIQIDGYLCCVQDMGTIWLLSFGITESITAGAEIFHVFCIPSPFIVLAQMSAFMPCEISYWNLQSIAALRTAEMGSDCSCMFG